MSFGLPQYDPTRPIVALDSETALFGRGCMAPLASCWSFAWFDEVGNIHTGLLSHQEGARKVMALLQNAIDGSVTLALQNAPYDFAVLAAEYPEALPLIFDAHEAGGIHDTMAAEWLIDTATGLLRSEFDEESGEWKQSKSYSLENLARIHLGWPPYKDEWRMRYAELRDVPISEYPEGAIIYPKRDAEATLRIAVIQREIAAGIHPHDPLVAMLAHVCRTYMALHLVAVWGEELDPERVEDLDLCMTAYSQSFVPELEKAKLILRTMKGKNKGKLTKKLNRMKELLASDLITRGLIEVVNASSMDEAVAAVLAEPSAFIDDDDLLTDGGKSGIRGLSCKRAVLSDCVDERLKHMSGYLESEKLRTSFSHPMSLFGRGPLHSRYGWAETGRTTCSGGGKRNRTGLNVQQMPRKMPEALVMLMLTLIGEEIDVRSCYVPRPGYVQSSSDFGALEAVTFSQVCKDMVGFSAMGDAINEGADVHALFATGLLDDSYENTIARIAAGDSDAKDARQRSKVANFGMMGGMGAKKFVKYAKAQGVQLTLAQSKDLHSLFRQRWPEALQYFELASASAGAGGTTLVGLSSGLVRGGCSYTDWCNGNFQEHAAFGMKAALWRIVRECYDERCKSDLFGSRVTADVHDEYRAEHPEEIAHEAATRLADVARETMQEICPDVKVSIEPCLTRRWWKQAKTIRDEEGRLQVWQPKEAA